MISPFSIISHIMFVHSLMFGPLQYDRINPIFAIWSGNSYLLMTMYILHSLRNVWTSFFFPSNCIGVAILGPLAGCGGPIGNILAPNLGPGSPPPGPSSGFPPGKPPDPPPPPPDLPGLEGSSLLFPCFFNSFSAFSSFISSSSIFLSAADLELLGRFWLRQVLSLTPSCCLATILLGSLASLVSSSELTF